jgi:carboxypeptidase C (cathepsin A)
VNLTSNPYSWNKIANVIYIDQPCGVGFSYGEQPSDYETNDNQTAIDNYLFLQGFFDVYSEFSTNTFWITGESYAGLNFSNFEIYLSTSRSALIIRIIIIILLFWIDYIQFIITIYYCARILY